MSLITFRNVHKSFGGEIVFNNLNLQIHPSEKVGMVGANGSGKSTILKLITGILSPDMGDIVRQKGLRSGYLPQETEFETDRTVIEEMYAGLEGIFELQDKIHKVSQQMEKADPAELKDRMKQYDKLLHQFELAGGFEYEIRIKATLAGLGFEQSEFDMRLSALSGGQLSRVGLAKVLMGESDLLLLDEPTNHLDLQATEWLEKFLLGFKGAVVVISHDRYLLDKVAEKIIEVEAADAKLWPGNYSNFLDTKEKVTLEEDRQFEQRKEMVEKTRDFIARNKDQEGMRGTARGRKKRLKKLLKDNPDFLEKRQKQNTVKFSFTAGQSASELIFRCEDLSKTFDDKKLFDGLTFDILRGRRFAITGPNGSGKTTFLKIALGKLQPSSGTARLGENLSIGYLDQHSSTLDSRKSILEEARSAAGQMDTEKVRSVLGSFQFCGDDVFKKTSELSGGQQSRLMLCKLVLSKPDVLILDEPTNHLDIETRQMLESALADYEGTIITVSHDRFFLNRIAETLLVMGIGPDGDKNIGIAEMFSGVEVYSVYDKEITRRREQARGEKFARAKSKKDRKASSDAKSKTPEELKRFNKYSAEQLEQMIIELEKEIADMKERFGDSEIYKDVKLLARLQKDYDNKNTELDLLYRAYDRKV